jgi:hypothetical protein
MICMGASKSPLASLIPPWPDIRVLTQGINMEVTTCHLVSTWNVVAAVTHLRDKAESSSQHLCGRYTRRAIEAGGVTLTQVGSAKNYGPSLTAVGFMALDESLPWAVGDVAVIQSFAGHDDGHMQMYDGTNWVSDFVQRDFWPGQSYRKHQPDFIVYRYRDIYAAPPPVNARSRWECRV